MRMRQMKQVEEREMQKPGAALGGLSGWVLNRLRGLNIGRARRKEPRLAVIERIALAPRQSLALVEAEGRRFLVATSPEGTPAFHALEGGRSGLRRPAGSASSSRSARVSW
jgi:flagellar biogenesis protein FliO